MFYNVIKKYHDIVSSYQAQKFRHFNNAQELVAKITFIDQSQLYTKHYLFLDGSRRYSFHWQDKNGNLVIRWDNAPHYSLMKTFPHHKHIGDEVVESKEKNLESVLATIHARLKGKGYTD